MLQLVTRYLLQNRRVSIPEVGSFFITTSVPEPDTDNRIVGAPVFTTEFSQDDEVTPHQIFYLADATASNADHVKKELQLLGEQLKNRASRGIFEWKGFGQLRLAGDNMVFEPSQIFVQGLAPVTAERLHTSPAKEEVPVPLTVAVKQQALSAWTIVAWIVIVAAIAFIVWILYTHGWNLQALGLKIRCFSPLFGSFSYNMPV